MKHPVLLAWIGLILNIAAGDARDLPNIVFILADDLGYGDVGCYGSEDIETPHIDRIAGEGVRFSDFYANGAVCSPTRAAFLTGRYQQRIGMDNALYYQEMGRGLPVSGSTIAAALSGAGYVTGLSGKWHLGYDEGRRPHEQGFDHFFGLLGGNHHYFQHMDRIGVPDLWLNGEAIERDGYTTDLITADAVDFIEKNRAGPFFLFLSHAAPHFPWQGPGDRDKDIRPKKKSWQLGDRETYIAMVESMDEGIGEVLDCLDRLDLDDNTLVIFTSDNGGHTYSDNGPLRGAKSSIWEGGVKVPCVARWPRVLPRGVVASQVGITMDWTISFRRMAGLGVDPAGEDGIDLIPILSGDSPEVDRTLFWRRRKGPVRKNVEEGRAVRSGRWKLVEQATGESHLFDLAADPGESRDVIGEHPSVAERLRLKLDRWENEVSVKSTSPSE